MCPKKLVIDVCLHPLFCMMNKLFIQVGWNLADEVDSQGNDLFSLQRWEGSEQFSRTSTYTLVIVHGLHRWFLLHT